MTRREQRVLVTGATTGIGREAVELFARRGASVIITGRDTEHGVQTIAAIEAEGGHAEFIAADLSDVESVRDLADQVGEVDVLVNNAARHQYGSTLEQDVDSFDTAALLPKMIARGSGVVINIPAIGASVSTTAVPVAGAAKAALESLTRSWAAAFGANGIRVNAVAPGPTRTDSAVGALGEHVEQLGTAAPLGRIADPSEIAEVIVFLASPQASYITGETVRVDGGFTAI